MSIFTGKAKGERWKIARQQFRKLAKDKGYPIEDFHLEYKGTRFFKTHHKRDFIDLVSLDENGKVTYKEVRFSPLCKTEGCFFLNELSIFKKG